MVTPKGRVVLLDFGLMSDARPSSPMAADNRLAGTARRASTRRGRSPGYGFRAVVSTSFADIFRSNALKNGLLPIVVDGDVHAELMDLIGRAPHAELTVDLDSQTLTLPYRPGGPVSDRCVLEELPAEGHRRAGISAVVRRRDRGVRGCRAAARVHDPDLRHHAPRRHAARRHFALGGRQDPHRAPARRVGVRLHRGRLARLESQGRRVLRARPRYAVADGADRGVRLDLPGAGQPGRATPTSRRFSRRARRCAPSSARPGRCTSPMCCARRSTTTCASSRRAWRICGREGRRVIYDAEHFFDGYKADPAYALETLRAAVRGGAETVVLCDTNGGTMPWEIREIVAGCERSASASVRHPHPQRRRMRGGEHARRRARRRHAGAGHDQRLRRTLRQRELVLDHPGPRAQARPALPARRPAADAVRGVALRGRGRQPRARRPPGLRRQVTRSRTRAASTSPPCAARRRATSTSIRSWSATRCASW